MLNVHIKSLGSVSIMCLKGRIVVGETTTLCNAVIAQSGVSAVILDLGQVSTIDAGGLGVMLKLRQETQSRGIDFKLMNITRPVSRVLEITRLDSVFEVTSEAEVLSMRPFRRRASTLELVPCA